MTRLLGGLMIAIGALVAGLSGLCSVAFFASVSGNYGDWQGAASTLPLILLFGGIPIAAGIALAFAGRHVIRSAMREEVDDRPENLD